MKTQEQINEIEKIIDNRRNYLQLKAKNNLIPLDKNIDLCVFIREQSLIQLLRFRQKEKDIISRCGKETVEGELAFIEKCIKIKSKITVQKVTEFNAKCKNEYDKFKYRGNDRKIGWVASYPSCIYWDMSTSKSSFYATTKKEAIKIIEKAMYSY